MVVQERVYENTAKIVYRKPMTFTEFIASFGPKDFVELIDGSVVEREMVQLDHERLFGWLYTVLRLVATNRDLGLVVGSRTPVEIDEWRGRLPDILFVRKERMSIVRQKGIFGAPDLIVEIISPGDRPSKLNALETDYQRIGVNEIVFINQKIGEVRILRKSGDGYAPRTHTKGAFNLDSLGITLRAEWLFRDPLPNELETIEQLLKGR